ASGLTSRMPWPCSSPLMRVGVSRAFLEQALAFPGAALAVFILNTRHVDHAAHPRLAPQIGEECPHQLLQIDPVGLGAPGAPVHLDAGGIDFMVDDTFPSAIDAASG